MESSRRSLVASCSRFWAHLGPVLGWSGAFGSLGAVLARLGAVLGASWVVSGRSWGPLRPSWSVGSMKW
eukprot:124059-Pyramimonas_sp.AAC.1